MYFLKRKTREHWVYLIYWFVVILAEAANFIKKEILPQVFSCGFC